MRNRVSVQLLSTLLLTLCLPALAPAQGDAGRLKKQAQDKLEARAEQKLDKLLEALLKGKKSCAELEDEAEREKCEDLVAKKEAAAAKKAEDSEEDASAKPTETELPAESESGKPATKPARAWANYDFVPGARVLFAEDFSKERIGNFPRRLELINGNMEVVSWQGATWLRVSTEGAFAVKLPEKLPQRFTVEFDLLIPWEGMALLTELPAPGTGVGPESPHSVVFIGGTVAGVYRGGDRGGSIIDPRAVIPALFTENEHLSARPYRVRVEADGNYMKVYLDETRVANIPNADLLRTDNVYFLFNSVSDDKAPLISNISINAGGKQLYDALMADGRVATQGIFFDTGSDRIQPESTPTLKEIVAMLTDHADLKLLIEGHTDNVGAAEANRVLSDKRASAVLAYLVKDGINASRLTAKGLGATKPTAPNETPEGRQQNRRVELVKM